MGAAVHVESRDLGSCHAGDQSASRSSQTGVDLYWLPLGAGGWFVRMNGRIYEAIEALRGRRRPLELYHCALEVHVPEARFVIELTPIPDNDGASRGVVRQGPVGSRRLAGVRAFRYELRRWRDGVIDDIDAAGACPQRVSDDEHRARRILDLVGSVPTAVWGRDELGAGEMWSSNSAISWLLARSGLPTEEIRPPARGRAPGWDAGIAAARCAASSGRTASMAAPTGGGPREAGPRSRSNRVDRPSQGGCPGSNVTGRPQSSCWPG